MLILMGFRTWIKEPLRAASTQLPFGGWWKMDNTSWRVAWLDQTGELFAAEQGASDRYLVLGHFATKREINDLMRRWFDGDNLAKLVERLQP